MPTINEAEMLSLRCRYQAAHAAHQSCVEALNKARMSGLPLEELHERVANALQALSAARDKMLAAIRVRPPGS